MKTSQNPSRAGVRVTPLVLTFDEAPNIGRALDSLHWASRVIVLDSGSTDATESIARSYQNVDWHFRPFDNMGSQWKYGVYETGIETEFVLAMAADMAVSAKFLEEMQTRFLAASYAGAIVPFDYRIEGHSLWSSVLPPRLMIFNPHQAKVTQVGHTEEFSVEGPCYRFTSPLIHDDRKSLERWISSQLSYQTLNEEELLNGGRGRARDYIRRLGLMPPLMGAIAYVKAGGPFGGAAAARYAYERMTTEGILAIRLMNQRLTGKKSG